MQGRFIAVLILIAWIANAPPDARAQESPTPATTYNAGGANSYQVEPAPGSRYGGPEPEPAQWPAPTHFISPAGSDENAGTSMEAPWLTFQHAVAELRPGNVLGVMDGTYTPETTGLLFVDCGSHAPAYAGLKQAPITIRAIHERRARLESDGLVPAVWITNCRNWNVLGLTAIGADKKTSEYPAFQSRTTDMEPVYVLVGVHRSRSIALKRILAARSNRLGRNGNNHVYAIEESSDIIVEESEAYDHHRHAMICWRCEHVTFRRNYVNPRDHWRRAPGITDDPSLRAEGAPTRRWADEGIAFYQGSWGLAENNIIEGRNLGFQVHGGDTFTADLGGAYNHFLGNIALNNMHATRIDARRDPYAQARPAVGNVFRDFLIVGLEGGIGLWYSTTTGSVAENVTIYGGTGTGFSAGPRRNPPCEEIADVGGCTHDLRNALVFGIDGTGIETLAYDRWQVAYSNAYGNSTGNFLPEEAIDDEAGHIRHSMSRAPTGMGLGEDECIVFVPRSSNMYGAGSEGANIGASIVHRYVDGSLTRRPLWDPATGAFPHGSLVKGINDRPGDSLFDVHERLNVNQNGCILPYSSH